MDLPESFGTTSTEEILIGTNDDALVSKCSTVNAGYLEDTFAKAFLKRLNDRRAPIIHRGTYTRTIAIDRVVERFLSNSWCKHSQRQIISLGAGSDTRYMRLKTSKKPCHLYVEIDLPSVTAKKAFAMSRNKVIKEMLGPAKIDAGGTRLIANDYWLIPGDLRDFQSILMVLKSLNLDMTIPTLFLSECVLVYLDPQDSNQILASIASEFSTSAIVIYEQIHPDDAFGRIMIENLSHRHIFLPGLLAIPTLEAQSERLLQMGFSGISTWTLRRVWDDIISDEEKKRISKLEIFDEVEEWNLLGDHYCIVVGVKSSLMPNASDIQKIANDFVLQSSEIPN